MGNAHLRNVAAIIGGVMLAALVVTAVDRINAMIYPVPAFNPANRVEMIRQFQLLPVGAFLFLLGAWIAGALAGSWMATRVGGSHWHGYAATVLFGASVAMNLAVLPHPKWLWMAALIATPLAGYIGTKIGLGLDGLEA